MHVQELRERKRAIQRSLGDNGTAADKDTGGSVGGEGTWGEVETIPNSWEESYLHISHAILDANNARPGFALKGESIWNVHQKYNYLLYFEHYVASLILISDIYTL